MTKEYTKQVYKRTDRLFLYFSNDLRAAREEAEAAEIEQRRKDDRSTRAKAAREKRKEKVAVEKGDASTSAGPSGPHPESNKPRENVEEALGQEELGELERDLLAAFAEQEDQAEAIGEDAAAPQLSSEGGRDVEETTPEADGFEGVDFDAAFDAVFDSNGVPLEDAQEVTEEPIIFSSDFVRRAGLSDEDDADGDLAIDLGA